MVFKAVIGSLENGNALVSPFFGLAGNNVLIALTQFPNIAVDISADAGHLDVFHRLPFAKQRELAALADVRKDNVPVAQVGVLIQVLFEPAKRLNVEALYIGYLRVTRRARSDRERVHGKGEKVLG